jgi:hypothetical protein
VLRSLTGTTTLHNARHKKHAIFHSRLNEA